MYIEIFADDTIYSNLYRKLMIKYDGFITVLEA